MSKNEIVLVDVFCSGPGFTVSCQPHSEAGTKLDSFKETISATKGGIQMMLGGKWWSSDYYVAIQKGEHFCCNGIGEILIKI